MSEAAIPVYHSNDEGMSKPEPGLNRQIMSFSPSMMLVRHTMTPGWTGVRHSHPHEQMIFVIRGEIRLNLPTGEAVLKPGASIIIPGGVEHQASTPVETEAIDVFSPMREDYVG